MKHVLSLRSKRGFWVPGLETQLVEMQLVEMQCGGGRLAAPPLLEVHRVQAHLVKGDPTQALVQAPLVQAHPVWVRVSVQYL